MFSYWISHAQALCALENNRIKCNAMSTKNHSASILKNVNQGITERPDKVDEKAQNYSLSQNVSSRISEHIQPRKRRRRSMKNLTWNFYTHVNHEFIYRIPAHFLRRCFPLARFRLSRYPGAEYTWLQFNSAEDQIIGFPMHGDEGKYTLTLTWLSTSSYGANGEARLTLHVLPNPENEFYWVSMEG